jgi:D-alanyl-lipoteichoic acid acyltransferase DltB (MBOAT superfamily)
VAANVLVLVAVRYLPFLSASLAALVRLVAPGAAVPVAPALVSIGVSYFVFQGISYLADVYLELDRPEPHPGHLALYLAFFPKLLQGPIERRRDLLPQLQRPYAFDYEDVRAGLVTFCWGLAKKVVVADRLAVFVDPVFDGVHDHAGVVHLAATYLYAFQIYMDFSGYTDMALGTARLFGVRLTPNFRRPMAATSIADFWRRWHVSFSRWILDYVFAPLQLTWRRLRTHGTALALLVAFLVSGLWHGASWGFVAWGALHGAYLAASTYYRPLQKRLDRALGPRLAPLVRAWRMFTTFQLVAFSWIFFRAPSLGDAAHVVRSIATSAGSPEGLVRYLRAQSLTELKIAIAAAVLVLAAEAWAGDRGIAAAVVRRGPVVRWAAYYALVLGVLALGSFGSSRFIYFQF